MNLEASGVGFADSCGNGQGHSSGEGLCDCTNYIPVSEYHWNQCHAIACGLAVGWGYSDCTGEG
jgi:hypothetical protein